MENQIKGKLVLESVETGIVEGALQGLPMGRIASIKLGRPRRKDL